MNETPFVSCSICQCGVKEHSENAIWCCKNICPFSLMPTSGSFWCRDEVCWSRFSMVLTTVYDTPNYWVFELCPWSGILEIRTLESLVSSFYENQFSRSLALTRGWKQIQFPKPDYGQSQNPSNSDLVLSRSKVTWAYFSFARNKTCR
jgi:hypothetical protein